MWTYLVLGLTVVSALHHDVHSFPGRNQRIIKVNPSPYKHHPHHKHTRPGPLGPHVHYYDYDNDYHYEYIRPNRPPPIPPFVNGPSPSPHKFLSRPPSHGPYKTSPYGNPYKSANNFRSPAVKDHFRSPSIPLSLPSKALSSPSFQHLPSSSSSLNHVINSDNNRGPIHEIPAPNLGPKPGNIESKPLYSSNPEMDFSRVKEPEFNNEFANQLKESQFKKPSYEVVESNDKIIEKPDGSKGYYAPDPDPSLPAPKLPPTEDPHSLPSPPKSNENFPTGQEYQILETGPSMHAPIPNLSSQELYDLMHSFPNDQYTVVQTSILPQPVVTLLGPQPTMLNQYVQPIAETHAAVDNTQQYHDFNHPHYQSFNYEENNPNAAAVPMENYLNQLNYEQDASESDSGNSVTVVRNTEEGNMGEKKTESVKKTLPNDLLNVIPDDDFERGFSKDQDKSPIFNIKEPEVPFYSSLPNKETAEALATLQAAGSVASKINQMRGDQNPNEESSEEVRNHPFGLPKNEISKPQQVNNVPNLGGQILVSDDYEEEEPQATKTEEHDVEVQKSVPLYESHEEIHGLDVGQGAISEKFGKKITPKN